jgi:hypothetical protein
MPTLLILVPCETVVLGQNEAASLINLISEVHIAGLPEIVPEGAAAPYKWAIFTEWNLAPDETQRRWEQHLKLVSPEGEILWRHEVEMPVSSKARNRVIAQFNTFTIIPAGEYKIEAEIREVATEEWTEIHAYPLIVRRI